MCRLRHREAESPVQDRRETEADVLQGCDSKVYTTLLSAARLDRLSTSILAALQNNRHVKTP